MRSYAGISSRILYAANQCHSHRIAPALAFSSCISSSCNFRTPGRALACPAVLRLPTPTSASKIGKPATREQVAAAYGVSIERLKEVQPPQMILFTQVDLARNAFATLISGVTASTPDLRSIGVDLEAARKGTGSNASPSTPKPVEGARTRFESQQWTSVVELIQFYEEVMYPLRCYHEQYALHQLNSFHMKDVQKRGLSAFKQEVLNENKIQLEKELAGMAKSQSLIADGVKESLTTDICNDIVNILRIVGEKYEHAHAMAVKVLEDMNTMKIPYNEVTRELIKMVSFRDGPFDNSSLLFEIIEYPERGEIVLETEKKEGSSNLEECSTEVLNIIAQRHQVVLDNGKLLRSEETHPNLQRSPE